jgi:hypothetical protein
VNVFPKPFTELVLDVLLAITKYPQIIKNPEADTDLVQPLQFIMVYLTDKNRNFDKFLQFPNLTLKCI